MSKTKSNLIYNTVYQILILLIPLITMPYISRILGVNGIGIYSYTYSIVCYFMILSMIGFNNYGNRTIAKSRDDKKLLTKNFKEIHLLQIITTTIMIFLYFLFLLISKSDYKLIFLLQSMCVLSCMFDINWFFFGLEEFKLTVLRNSIIKIISLALIFVFVKTKNDVWIYTLILSGSTLISQLSLWPFVNKRIDKEMKVKYDLKKHIIPCLKLFLPVIAVTIYRIMDKTMLGFFSGVEEVGFYENAEKIINVPVAIITAFGTVMLPKMSNIYSKNKSQEKSLLLMEKSISLIMFLSFAMTFGIFAISKNFSTIFFGKPFAKTGLLIQYLSITIIFLGWGNVVRTQFLIPKERDKEYIVSAFIGAGINFVLNLIFIPKYGSSGACIGTIFAEFFVMLYQTISIKEEILIKKYLKNIIPFFLKSLIMFFVVFPLNYYEMNNILKLFIQVSAGSLLYLLLNYKYLYSIVFKKNNA